jgi:serine/threonine-protein kinase
LQSDLNRTALPIFLSKTSQLPFTPLRAGLKVRLHTKKNIKPPSAFNSKISEQLQYIILKAMAWDIEKRYQWVEDLLADLEHACGAKER